MQMNPLIRIDDEIITTDHFIKFLKLTNEFPDLMERLIRNKITVHAAKKKGIEISAEELQQAADDFRRCLGLHRTKDTYEWMERIGIAPEEFESFITEHIYKKKMVDIIVNDEAVERYFQLNSPEFDTADIQHIVVEGEDKAKELIELLNEQPEDFPDFVKEYSIDDETRDVGGKLKELQRGVLPNEIEARIFNARQGDIIGPFKLEGEDIYEIIQVKEIKSAELNDSTKEKITELLYDKWLQERMKDHCIDMEMKN